MKKPTDEQLINNGLIEGTDFSTPVNFAEDSWGKYDEKKRAWKDPETGELVKVATFGQVRKWIQDNINGLHSDIEELQNNTTDSYDSLNDKITINQNNISTLQTNQTNINNKVTNNEDSINNLRSQVTNLTNNVNENEQVASQSLNDLNTRIINNTTQINDIKNNHLKISNFEPGANQRMVQKYKKLEMKDYTTNTTKTFYIVVGELESVTYYTVKFNTNGGDPISQRSVEAGTSITLPTPTARSGYIFSGWYKNSSLTGTSYTSSYTVTGDVTFYAKWTAVSGSVTMYSFSEPQSSNFTSSEIVTILPLNKNVEITNRLRYHYIPANNTIKITKDEYDASGVKTVQIGTYNSTNHIYKIENSNLINELIKYTY